MTAVVGHCAIVHDEDEDFGDIGEINPTSKVTNSSLPSQKIERHKIAHLSEQQQEEILNLLDQFSECFADRPEYCDMMQPEIDIDKDFRPKRLSAYRVPENLKPEIQQMLDLGIIKPSKNEMASHIVYVLKGKQVKMEFVLRVDYRCLNKHCEGDFDPLPNVDDVIQQVGKANWISTFNLKGAYLNMPVKQEQWHQWLTAFVWDEGLYEFTPAPCGQKGCTFVRVLQQVLEPIKEFADSYVDDISVFLGLWPSHLAQTEKFLHVINDLRIVLNLKKTSLAQSQVKFLGHIIGSGQRKADQDKVKEETREQKISTPSASIYLLF